MTSADGSATVGSGDIGQMQGVVRSGGVRDQVPWWKQVCAYQIYPRSFCDSNGDGIGDIPGILTKLDYLADLGIGMIWLSPVYRSPMCDNGYDISDYRDIAQEYGTLADMDRLIAEAGRRDIRIVMDLVVNHTSDQHAWFKDARSGRDALYRDFYIWRDPGPGGGPPSDLQSFFGGPAWSLCRETDQYYLHLFAPEQPDLNWQNPRLRAETYDMMRWWVARGISGFRMDVIDLIGKDIDRGVIAEGPLLWSYLEEMQHEVTAGTDLVTIGESWHASTRTAPRYVAPTGPLSMIFQFDHVVAGWGPGRDKWAPQPFSPEVLRDALFRWQELFSNSGWNAVFLGNHDLPRMASAFGDGSPAAAKALATLLLCLRGTPFIFQGDEIGTPNAGFDRSEAYRDVETINLLATAEDPRAALLAASINSRDNARTPMRWTSDGGFTNGTPWIDAGASVTSAAEQREDKMSVLSFYRNLIGLRARTEALRTGGFAAHPAHHPAIIGFRRTGARGVVDVVINLSGQVVEIPAMQSLARTILMNTHAEHHPDRLAPFQAVLLAHSS